MTEYALALTHCRRCSIFCHFDARNAGFGSMGVQNVPKYHGELSPRQHAARVMVSLLQQTAQDVFPLHVHAHDLHPWNECSDSLAVAVRKGWNPPRHAALRSGRLLQHKLRDWAWIEIAPTKELPCLHDILRNDPPHPQQGWPDSTFVPPSEDAGCSRSVDLRVATLNVGTLNYSTEEYTSSSFKTRELLRQFDEADVDVIGIQESRARHSQCIVEGPFFRIIAAGNKGHDGVELWLRTDALTAKFGQVIDTAKDICVIHSSSRMLVVHLNCHSVDITFVVCYAPQRGRSDQEIQSWWDCARQTLEECLNRGNVILVGDLNCKVGSIPADGIGTRAADFEDLGGENLRQVCNDQGLTVVNTFDDFHQGSDWTYMNPQGHRSRIDFILVSDAILNGVSKSYIDDNIDPMNGGIDHRVLVVHLQIQYQRQVGPMMRRVALFDRNSARDAKHVGHSDLLKHIPEQDWQVDVNAHWSVMRDSMQSMCKWYFPKPKRQRRQLYFSEACWNLVVQRKELRQQHRDQLRERDMTLLAGCFKAWKGENVESHGKTLHLQNLQCALVLKMRQDIDSKFRLTKRKEWKDWLDRQLAQQMWDLEYKNKATIYNVFRPKKLVDKHLGKHRRQHPGLRSSDGTWLLSRESIAAAWQTQFADIENAEDACVNKLIEQSKPTSTPVSVEELCQLPTIYQMECAIRSMTDSKTAGLDGLGAELFQHDVVSASKKLFPIYLKAAIRRQEIPEHTGGWLLPLHKGKNSVSCLQSYRGILLEPVAARIISKMWRNHYTQGLSMMASPMQYGGRRGLSPTALHTQIRMWQSNAAALGKSLAIIFMDIRSAFYSVVKQFLTGECETQEKLAAIFMKLKLPQTAWHQFQENLHGTNLAARITTSKHAQANIRSMLCSTWFAIPDAPGIKAPQTGSRPGDPLADILFSVLMTTVLETIDSRLDALGLLDAGFEGLRAHALSVTWVDGAAFAVYSDAEGLCSKVAATMDVIMTVMLEHGLHLSYGPGKTAIIMAYHGKGAVRARQKRERDYPHEMPVMSEHMGAMPIPIVGPYKHLGSFIVKSGGLLPEIKIRSVLSTAKLKPLRKILCNEGIDIRRRRNLLQAMGLSIATLNAGSWFNMGQGEYRMWHAIVHNLYRMLTKFIDESPTMHKNMYQLAELANCPMPMEWLFITKLRLIAHIVQVGDEMMFEAIMFNYHCAGSKSWLASACRAVEWLCEQVGKEVIPTDLKRLTCLDAWTALQPHARVMKKLISKAQYGHMLRVKTLNDLKDHAQFQKTCLQELGWVCREDICEEQAESLVECDECGKSFSTEAALAVHASRKHGTRIAVRRFTHDATCRVCHRHYHSRPRLILHLHYGSTPCWVALMRAHMPLSEHVANELDQHDKENKQASHQRGLKSSQDDHQWRMCSDDGLLNSLPWRNESECYDTTCPTIDELTLWRTYGMLPPGKGGRSKTSRSGKDPEVRNVVHDTRQFEVQMCERVQTWAVREDVPRPLATDEKFFLVFFSGHRRWGDLPSYVQWKGIAHPVAIDLAVCTCHGNMFDYGKWLNLVKARRVLGGHGGPPCETYTLARWLPNEGKTWPRPLRDHQDPWGKTHRTVKEVRQAAFGTWLMTIVLRLLLAIYCQGGCITLEHPAGVLEHCDKWCVWAAGVIRELQQSPHINVLLFLQGPLGRPYAKPTRLLYGRLPTLPKWIFSSYTPGWKATETLGGKSGKQWKTSAAKAYPERMCEAMASAYEDFATGLQCEGHQAISGELQAAIDALSNWDPYDESGVQTDMKADYHPAEYVVRP